MARDFDQETKQAQLPKEEREFILGGEPFVAMANIRPEVLAEFEKIQKDTPALEVLQILDDLIVQMIEPDDDAETRYRAVRARTKEPVTMQALQTVGEWLVEIATGRPTGPPVDSSASHATTGDTSTGDSSSPARPLASVV